jgi:carbonic anhydrase
MPNADLDEQACACSRKAIAASLENLKSYPWIADKITRQQMNLHGWYFNLANGDLEEYNSEQQGFTSLFSA